MGASLELLTEAFEHLQSILSDCRMSSVYRSKARYVLDQPDFYNAVVCGTCRVPPDSLLEQTQAIEARLGRNRKLEIPKGPRTMDIDILLYGSHQSKTALLEIPHPGMTERAFVLRPLLELDAGITHPITGRPLAEYLDQLAPQDVHRIKGLTESPHV